MNVITVSQVNTYIKALLDESTPLRNIYISGEISNFTYYYRSGHMYFTLKDEKSQLKAVMFASYAVELLVTPPANTTGYLPYLFIILPVISSRVSAMYEITNFAISF